MTTSVISSMPSGQIATILFLTVVHERRSDLDRYQFSIDRCYTNVEQANERVGLLKRCNSNITSMDVVRQGRDHEHGCFWVSMTEENSDHIRYFVEVKCMWMLGNISTSDGLAANTASEPRSQRLLSTLEHDLAGHVFVIAIHEPDNGPSLAFDGKPSRMNWTVESVHSSCSNALDRSRRVWQTACYEQHGPPQRAIGHYGLCRFALLPRYSYSTVDWMHRALHFTGAQIRIERVKVTLPDERIEMFVPARAILHNKPWLPLCPGRETKLLERYLQELRDACEPDDDLPWEKDIADIQMLDRLRHQRAEDTICQRAPPPLRRALNDILTNYTQAVSSLADGSATPPSIDIATPVHRLQAAAPLRRALSGMRRSLSLHHTGSSDYGLAEKLKRRSHYSSHSAGDPGFDQQHISKTTARLKSSTEVVAVQFQRTMLTGSFTCTRF